MMKSLHRKSKKCDTEEQVAKTKAKNAFKNGDIECARIHAEKAVLKRKLSQHYQLLSARLSPVLQQLKEQFNDSSNSSQNVVELQQLLNEITTMGQQEHFDVSNNEINGFIQNLNSDQSYEASFQASTLDQIADVEQRLANLRRKSP